MILLAYLVWLAAFSLGAFADVQFTKPASGGSVAYGPTLSVGWQEGSGDVKLADLAGYVIFLMVGGNGDGTDATVAQQLASFSGSHATGMTASIPLASNTIGPPGANAYFLKIQSTAKDGSGQFIFNYSDRFTISGMKGSWPTPALRASWQKVSGPGDVPATQNQITGNGAAPAAGQPAAGGPYGISFQFQTGPTRYAPMQQRPPTAITKDDTGPLFPTSRFVPAQTYLALPTVVTTLTAPPEVLNVVSKENTASPAPMPTDDMQKFLARWRD